MSLSTMNGTKRLFSDVDVIQKWAIIAYATQYRQNGDGRMVNGSIKVVQERFGVDARTIQRTLAEYDKQIADGVVIPDLTPQSRSNCGPASWLTDEIRDNITDLHNLSKGKLTIRGMGPRSIGTARLVSSLLSSGQWPSGRVNTVQRVPR